MTRSFHVAAWPQSVPSLSPARLHHQAHSQVPRVHPRRDGCASQVSRTDASARPPPLVTLTQCPFLTSPLVGLVHPARPAELHKAAVELEEDYSRVVARAQKEAADASARAARIQEELEAALAGERDRAASAGAPLVPAALSGYSAAPASEGALRSDALWERGRGEVALTASCCVDRPRAEERAQTALRSVEAMEQATKAHVLRADNAVAGPRQPPV